MRLKLYRGKWCVVWRENGRTKRISLGTADRALAERKFHDVRRERPGDTIGEIVPAYLAEKKGVARSHEAMEAAWKALKPTFGALDPEHVTRLLCRSYAARRRKAGRSDGTVIKELGVLRAALRWARKDAGATFELPHAPPPRERWLTRAEYDRLVEACEHAHVALFVILALATAGRAGAILDLTWDRVDFERGHIRLSKGEGSRKGRATVPMTERARKALLESYPARTTDYVIEWGGKPVKSVKRAFAAACARAKLEGVSPHILRHTSAVWQAQAGVPIGKIAEYLGHTDSRITERVYSRFSPDFLRDAAAALE